MLEPQKEYKCILRVFDNLKHSLIGSRRLSWLRRNSREGIFVALVSSLLPPLEVAIVYHLPPHHPIRSFLLCLTNPLYILLPQSSTSFLQYIRDLSSAHIQTISASSLQPVHLMYSFANPVYPGYLQLSLLPDTIPTVLVILNHSLAALKHVLHPPSHPFFLPLLFHIVPQSSVFW